MTAKWRDDERTDGQRRNSCPWISAINRWSSINQSCIRALSRNQTNSRSTWLTHNILQAIGSSIELVIEWIPGQSNYYGNETADKFANRGCITKYLPADPILPLRESVINSQIRKWTLSIWQRRWQSQPTCPQTKL